MIKITLAINPFAISKHALDFASFLARLTQSILTAAILENKEMARQQEGVQGEESQPADLVFNQAISWFKEAATAREVGHKIHRDRGMPFEELIMESRFSDVLVMHPAISFSRKFKGEFTPLAEDILKRAECPLFIAGTSVERVDEIIFAYDRSASSMFALKLFLYLFPVLSHTPLTVIHVQSHEPSDDVSQYNFKEWVTVHCHGHVEYINVTGDTDQQLLRYVHGKQNAILVMGGYRRSDTLSLRTKSYAEWVIRGATIPVFITHR